MTSEATSQYLDRVAEDVEALLGTGVVLLGVAAADRPGSVHLSARYDLSGKVYETVASGENIVAAHAALRMELARDRLRLGFENLVNGG